MKQSDEEICKKIDDLRRRFSAKLNAAIFPYKGARDDAVQRIDEMIQAMPDSGYRQEPHSCLWPMPPSEQNPIPNASIFSIRRELLSSEIAGRKIAEWWVKW